MKNNKLLFLGLLSLTFFACNDGGKVDPKDTESMYQASPEEVEKLIEDFIMVEEGGTITIPAGFYDINSQLILDGINNVKIIGAGMDETILSFKRLTTGGEGMKIVGDNVLLQDFSVYDAPGDGVKAQHCDGITFRRVNATWTNGDKSKNGTYAIYPVQCKNVVVDECIASHSRDAGIYIGQSENIIVKNSEAFGNVAGIEIENCDNAEVFNNNAHDNAGGVLVFNLPGLMKADARGTKIYDNEIVNNNHENFASTLAGNNGNAVTQIPPGSGVIILAAKGVEVYNNRIKGNKTVAVTVASYQITQFPFDTSNGWSPYSIDIYVHDNEYERPAALPDMSKELGQLVSMKNAHGPMKTQDIVYDGILNPDRGTDITTNPMNICFKEPQMEDLHFNYFELTEKISDIKAFKDYSPFVCEQTIETNVSHLMQR
ncbi:MAG: right-handed parallel beta-helix repeat-containing protein [Chitinophagales bacterium]|nr:right-handed parallel beta-helix repeat-containing protein [Bacteroidota bacterium]MCB9257658.1 right-handed parallel beta-helix repeat-containing protein [Chitinophagales bacterium]